MRPIRLEMKGFTSFRDRTEVNFEDADLFVLTGPTGAGKSSVIDAITFALYGSIPRLGGNSVEPVISRGMLQMSVRLDFAVGEKRYTAVRMAGTKSEARLEDEYGNPLAGSSMGLKGKVEEILGLSFGHFTKSVVLPQGHFANLLHETASERHKMLQRLLGTELFTRLAYRAGQRKDTSKALADNMERDMAQLEAGGITPGDLKAARRRAQELFGLEKRIRETQPESDALNDRALSAKQRGADIWKRLDLLSAVRPPEGVQELAEELAKGKRGIDDAKKAHDEAADQRLRLEEALHNLPKEADLRQRLRRYHDLAKERTERDRAAARLEDARTVLQAAQAVAGKARTAAEAAEQALRAMEDEHSAYHLASGLSTGSACPVCRQPVSEPPEMEAPAEMEEARDTIEAARQDRISADADLANTQADASAREQSLKDSQGRVTSLEAELKDEPSREEIESDLAQVTATTGELEEANRNEREARKRLAAAQQTVSDLEGDGERAWQDYDKQRDRLAEMQPPAAKREDLAVAWNDLTAWSKKQAKEQRTLHEKTEAERKTAESTLEELRGAIAEWCSQAGVVVAHGEEPLTACGREQGRQAGEVKRIEQGLESMEQKRAELKCLRRKTAVAADLARHLGSRNFVQWLMDQVLNQLCVGASKELLKLSRDAYSLELDDSNNFVVVDRNSAGARRPVKTLSGGETFLASLSLALSLSEHLADLTVGRAAKLEALFLDEGFGTLDSDTLDDVIQAIEELGSRGRMVGVVTHVKELAESIPIRYEVTKQGNRSSIERIEA